MIALNELADMVSLAVAAVEAVMHSGVRPAILFLEIVCVIGVCYLVHVMHVLSHLDQVFWMSTIPDAMRSSNAPTGTVFLGRRMVGSLFGGYGTPNITIRRIPFATLPVWIVRAFKSYPFLMLSGIPRGLQSAIDWRNSGATTTRTRNLWKLCDFSELALSIAFVAFDFLQHFTRYSIPPFFGWQAIRKEVMPSWNPHYS